MAGTAGRDMNFLLKSAGKGEFSDYAKQRHAEDWFCRGVAFLQSGILLAQHGGDGRVVLHLYAQGIEIVLKSLLIVKNPNNYPAAIREKGHDLVALLAAVEVEYGGVSAPHPRFVLTADERKILGELGEGFKVHEFRCPRRLDLVMAYAESDCTPLLSKLKPVCRLLRRHFARL